MFSKIKAMGDEAGDSGRLRERIECCLWKPNCSGGRM